VVLGARGGLGSNIVRSALGAGHSVRAVVRDPTRYEAPDGVEVVGADAAGSDEVQMALRGQDVCFFCVNPPFSRWAELFPGLLSAALQAAASEGLRLVFPGNVWIYGSGRPGEEVGEGRPATPTSQRGRLRARMEEQIRDADLRSLIVRLPEFYGPHVVTLTARILQAALTGKRAIWPGPLDLPVEFIFLPDAAEAMVRLGCDGAAEHGVVHLPGVRTTAREFAELAYRACGRDVRIVSVPRWLLRIAGLFDGTAAGAADIAHLWSHPVLLDGARYRAIAGEVPCTPLGEAVEQTLDWMRAASDLRLQG
jgi:nucleoside-diphosphate-sugar epimerase